MRKLCALVWLGCVCALTSCQVAPSDTPTPTKSDGTPTVKVLRPQRTTLTLTTTQPTTVHAYHEAEIYARVAGYLDSLKVDIGDRVKEGDVLGEISVPEMVKSREWQLATIEQLKRDEQRYAASIKLSAANVDAADASRVQAQAEVRKSFALLNADQAELKRIEELVTSKAVAARLLDEARKRYESSLAVKTSFEAALKSATAKVTVAEQQLSVAEADVSAAQQSTQVAIKRLEEMDTLMSFATLKAPFNGVVIERKVDPGDLVKSSQAASGVKQEPLFLIAQVDRVRIRVAIPEDDAPWANVGDMASIRLRALAGKTFEGPISRVASRLDHGTRTMLIEIDLKNDGDLVPGMYGEATVKLEEIADSLVLPATAIRYDETGGSSVYVVGSDNMINVVQVTTGIDNGKSVQITSELDSNAQVVAGSLGRLKAGQRVKVATEK